MISARLQRLAFYFALAGFAGLLLAGLYRDLALERRAPQLSNEYGAYVNELAVNEDWEGVIRALRISASLDLIETRVSSEIIPNLARLARRRGDRDSELVAWRSLAERQPAEVNAHLQLAWALLDTASPGGAELGEAAAHARWALSLEPGSVPARVSLGRVALLEGDRDGGFARWREAARLDPELTEQLLSRLSDLDPEATESFRTQQTEEKRG